MPGRKNPEAAGDAERDEGGKTGERRKKVGTSLLEGSTAEVEGGLRAALLHVKVAGWKWVRKW